MLDVGGLSETITDARIRAYVVRHKHNAQSAGYGIEERGSVSRLYSTPFVSTWQLPKQEEN